MRWPLTITLLMLTTSLVLHSTSALLEPREATIQLSGTMQSNILFVQTDCAILSGTLVRSEPVGTDTAHYHLQATGLNAAIDLTMATQEVPIWDGYSGITLATGRISMPACGVDLEVALSYVDFNVCNPGSSNGDLHFIVGNVELRWFVTATCTTTQGPGVVSDPQVEVGPPGTTLVPVPLASTGQGPIAACAGTVQVTFTNGASVPLPGARLGSAPCSVANPPCESYVGLPGVAGCSANPAGCCTPLYEATPETADYLCVRESFVRIDVNDDGVWDVTVPVAATTPPPC